MFEQESLAGFSRAQVGFLAFDSDLHFIRFTRKHSEASIFTITDLADVFIPFQESIIVHAEEFKAKKRKNRA